jgi:hypothetical protein
MAKPPGRCDHHPGQPRPAPHDNHPGPWLPAALMLRAEEAQARDETVRITAPVRMMRPDEIPAAAPSLIHLPARPQPRRRVAGAPRCTAIDLMHRLPPAPSSRGNLSTPGSVGSLPIIHPDSKQCVQRPARLVPRSCAPRPGNARP